MEGDRKSVRKPRAKTRTHDFTDRNRGIRLQKALADAGVAARRDCEELVLSGAVTVNGHTVDTLPAWVDPATDRIEVYGRPIRRSEEHVYVVLFKPRGTVCTNSDPEGRARAIDLVRHPSRARLYCVGRLDIDTSGLLVLTNDGEFANRLTHPRYGVAKGYDVTLDGSLGEAEIARLEREIFRRDRAGSVRGASSLKLINREADKTVVHLELCEHRNLQIRPLMLELGHPVKKLRRTSFGPLRLKGLAVGEWRDLTPKEIEILRSASRGGGGQALAPKAPKRSMVELAAAREARAAALAPSKPTDSSAVAGSTDRARASSDDAARGATRGDARGAARGDVRGAARGNARGAARGDARGAARGDARGAARGDARGAARGDARGDARGGARGDARGDARGGARATRGAAQRVTSGPRRPSVGGAGGASNDAGRGFSRDGARGSSKDTRGSARTPGRSNDRGGGEARARGGETRARGGETRARGGETRARGGERRQSRNGRSPKGRGR